MWLFISNPYVSVKVPARGPDHRLAPRYEEVERQYASLPRPFISEAVGAFSFQAVKQLYANSS
ncbi:hypothetical protein D4764_01G0003680 [Takifugu flavidus]|uniref:Uncharacterized protein n=1 Tax=Takifugu flavidus TaxID=433684 RepID=A0A5C6PMD0_9TELE|nr:hypothetical protein D4764_01G0003680 [Takifugu flavidus]